MMNGLEYMVKSMESSTFAKLEEMTQTEEVADGDGAADSI